MFSDRDLEHTINIGVSTIMLNNSSASSQNNTVLIDGTTIKITKEGNYKLTGTLNNGKIIIETTKDDKVTLILDNVNIISNSFACIYNMENIRFS